MLEASQVFVIKQFFFLVFILNLEQGSNNPVDDFLKEEKQADCFRESKNLGV